MQIVEFDPTLLLAFSEKSEGNIDERFGARSLVVANRKKVLSPLGLGVKDVVEGKQIHSDRILTLNGENSKMWAGINIAGVDGFATNEREIAAMVKLADCVPVVILDPIKKAYALVHAGWRGTVANIHLKALERIEKEYGVDPKTVKVWIGPSARKCHFISEEEPNQLNEDVWKPFIEKQKNGWTVDLPEYLKETVHKAGVKKANIIDSNICTVETETLYSHIRSKNSEEPEGRFAVVAKLK